jgi:3-phenylpropionate/trans-cinnamate dioxygenase ferredoxin reductase subunit
MREERVVADQKDVLMQQQFEIDDLDLEEEAPAE